MLTDASIRAAKPKDKPYKLSDGSGLYLLIGTSGSKIWKWKYRHDGKEKLLTIGPYPIISLREARETRDKAKGDLLRGIEPLARKVAAESDLGLTFRGITSEWLEKKAKTWAAVTAKSNVMMIERHLMPYLSDRTARSISPMDALAVLQKIEAKGKHETTRRCCQCLSQIMRFAVVTGRADMDPCASLSGAFMPTKIKHRAAITNEDGLQRVVRMIWVYDRSAVVSTAMKLQVMLACRPGELRHMEWAELDLEKGEWNIPAEKMKMREAHLVPLPRQAVELLKTLREKTGQGKYVFTNPRSPKGDRPMSENAVLVALRSMGFEKDEVTGHGFRATFRTLADEVLGERVDLIEQQLAHIVRDPLGRAYNRTKFIEQRREMMQRWADWLDTLLYGPAHSTQ